MNSMGPRGWGRKPADHDLFAQVVCARCGSAIYSDEATNSGKSGALCGECLRATGMLSRPDFWRIDQYQVPIIGMSLVETLAVVLILGMLAAVAIPPMLRFKEQAERTELEQLYLLNQGQQSMDLALSIQAGTSQEEATRLIQQAAQLAGVSAQDMPRFEADIKKYREYDTLELQAGAISKVIDEWGAKAKARLGRQELDSLP